MNSAILKAAQAVIDTATPGEEREWPEFERLRTAIHDWHSDQPTEEMRERIVTAAQELDTLSEGECEVDDDAIVSMGDENGCYVAAWVWTPFKGIRGLDKECPNCEEVHEQPVTADWECDSCGYVQKNCEEQEICRDCEEPYDPACGDSYDGRCPSCADKAEESAENREPCVKEFLKSLHASAEAGDVEMTPAFKKELAAIVKGLDDNQ